jgi:DNA uptake protein ComE-like DNA-binding protein
MTRFLRAGTRRSDLLMQRSRSIPALCLAAALLLAAGCGWNSQDPSERDAKIRDEVAKATERAKPVIEEAGRKLVQAAEVATQQAHAAAQGVQEGWNDHQHPSLDLNSATPTQLLDLPGITKVQARKIIAARPYGDKHELVTRGIVSDAEYLKIRDHITVR